MSFADPDDEVLVVRTDPADRPRSRHAPDARHFGFPTRWALNARGVTRYGVLALIAAFTLSALAASAATPRSTRAAARSTTPDFLLPIEQLVRHNYLPAPALHGDVGQVGVPVDAPKPPTAPNPGVAAGQGPAITQYRGTPGTLSAAAIATLALEHGCSPGAAVIAAAISMAESAGSPSAQGDIGLMTPVWDWSAGLWQIRGLRAERNTGALRDSVANQDVNKNAAAMYAISQGCTDWTPWSTYNSGAYLAFLALAQRAVEYVVTYFNAHGRRYPAVPAPDPNSAIPVQSSGGGDNPAAAAPASSDQTSTAPAPQPNGSAPKPARTSAAAPINSTPASAPASPPPPSSSAPGGTLQPPTTSTVVPPPTLTPPLPSTTLPIPLPTPTLPIPSLTL
ncbi:MAG: hypothetical protein ABI808_16295 [Pseudonocardiales bacterium]